MGQICNILLILSFIQSGSVIYAQTPIIKNYYPTDYNASPRNWSITQDSIGLIYIANDDGLLIYDGYNWDLKKIPGRGVRVLKKDKFGNIYLGTLNNFGMLRRLADGSLIYDSISDELPLSKKPIRTVFSIAETQTHIYFETQAGVFAYELGKPFKTTHHIPTLRFVSTIYAIKDTLYIQDEEHILKYQDDKLIPIRSRNLSDGAEIFSMIEKEDSVLVLTKNDKIYITDRPESQHLRLWNESLNTELKGEGIYYGTSKGKTYQEREFYVIPTNVSVITTDAIGNLNNRYDKDNGLISNSINYVYIEPLQNIWVVTSKGISRISYAYPITKWGEPHNLNYSIYSLLLYSKNNTLYAGTDRGLFYKNQKDATFHPVDKVEHQIWDLVEFNGDLFIAGGNYGIFQVRNNEVIGHINTPLAVMSVTQSTMFNDYFYFGLYNGFYLAKLNEATGIIELELNFDRMKGTIATITEDSLGNVWAGSRFDGIYSFNIEYYHYNPGKMPPLKQYTQMDGLSSNEHTLIYSYKDKILAAGESDILAYNRDSDRFEPYPKLNQAEYPLLYPELVITPVGIVEKQSKRIYKKQHDGSFIIDESTLKPIKPRIMDVVFRNDTWHIATLDGVYNIYNLDSLPSIENRFPIIYLNYTSQNQKEITFRSINSNSKTPVRIPSNVDNLKFKFTLPYFQHEEQTRFRYRLIGYSDEWTPYSTSHEAIIIDLKQGKYVFEVQSELSSTAHTYVGKLNILKEPKWFETPLAYMGLILFILFISGLIMYLNQYRLMRRTQYLESLVFQRTDEIQKQNKSLSMQTKALERANELKSKFLNMAVHDLKNPIGVILGLTDLLKEDKNDPEAVEEYSEQMEHIAKRIINNIQQVLKLEGNTVADLPMDKHLFNMSDLLEKVVSENSIIARQKQQIFETDIHPEIEIWGDRSHLRNAFDNLINNAIKYSPRNSKINVTLRKVIPLNINEPPTIRFCVMDEGSGFSNDDKAKLFEEFKPLSNQPTGNELSTGLGLSIVKTIILKHEGKVWVENRLDGKNGSMFFVELKGMYS